MTYTIIFRSIIIYFIVLILIRLMGKRQLGEMQPFEFVITLIIADLATIPMAETALPLVHGIIPILTLFLVHFFLSFLDRKSLKFRSLLNGRPVIVIGPDGVDYESLKKLNMNYNDLQESLRTAGYFCLDEILYAIMQTNGSISVLARSAYSPLTADDINLPKEQSTLPIIIVAEGKCMTDNLKLAKIDEQFILKEMESCGYHNIKDMDIITLDNLGKMYIKPKNKPFSVVKTSYQGGQW